jgi:hypothetical protein
MAEERQFMQTASEEQDTILLDPKPNEEPEDPKRITSLRMKIKQQTPKREVKKLSRRHEETSQRQILTAVSRIKEPKSPVEIPIAPLVQPEPAPIIQTHPTPIAKNLTAVPAKEPALPSLSTALKLDELQVSDAKTRNLETSSLVRNVWFWRLLILLAGITLATLLLAYDIIFYDNFELFGEVPSYFPWAWNASYTSLGPVQNLFYGALVISLEAIYACGTTLGLVFQELSKSRARQGTTKIGKKGLMNGISTTSVQPEHSNLS